jgi:hypothetical protein
MGRPQYTVRGTVTTSGQTTDLTPANLRTLITSDGTGTTEFLRKDGTWAVPAGGGGLSDGDKVDITVTGSGAIWNIDPGAVGTSELADSNVTYAKIQNVTAARLLGSVAGGAPEEMTASAALDLISTTRGTVLYRGVAAWSALAVGVDGQVLTTHGAGADPTWTTPSGGSGLSQAQVLARLSYGA